MGRGQSRDLTMRLLATPAPPSGTPLALSEADDRSDVPSLPVLPVSEPRHRASLSFVPALIGRIATPRLQIPWERGRASTRGTGGGGVANGETRAACAHSGDGIPRKP